ncbi:hypothetical protein Pyn_22131 [Prunus yedoensis var. nudiflora]|uniref:Uncharacterized protein n=1 Tax=Prunus yedoensis var. nudiflora TaxID=2094558 RepID=A0A314XSS5_PRUYE|nr:hypothetical protein Pyn_22131 [Prunus yedoensis var. nudiflora]
MYGQRVRRLGDLKERWAELPKRRERALEVFPKRFLYRLPPHNKPKLSHTDRIRSDAASEFLKPQNLVSKYKPKFTFGVSLGSKPLRPEPSENLPSRSTSPSISDPSANIQVQVKFGFLVWG